MSTDWEFNLDGYVLAHGVESIGSENFGLKLYVRIQRELTKNDSAEIRHLVGNMINALELETARLDPKMPEWKALTKGKFHEAFEVAGLGPIFMEEAPNEYWLPESPEALRNPWYIVTTRLGHFKVGWRKRVIVLDWSRTIIQKIAREVFLHEDVTKEGHMIHAWGYEKLAEYLKKLEDEDGYGWLQEGAEEDEKEP